jgi:hypothetical protein
MCVLTEVPISATLTGVSVGPNEEVWLKGVPLGAAVVGDWLGQSLAPSGLQRKVDV